MSDIRVRVGQNNAIKVLSSTSGGKALISENVIGGIADVNSLNVSGISTFNGNAYANNFYTSNLYASNFVGIGTTNPQYNLDVNGDINFTGIFYQNNTPFIASRWTSGTGDNIYRLNGNVGVGTTNPTTKLEVRGVIGFTDTNIRIGDNTTGASITPTIGIYNAFIGYGAGTYTSGGLFNNFIGYNSGKTNTLGNDNNFFGTYSGTLNTIGNSNNFFGKFSGLYNTIGGYNNFFGSLSGFYNRTGFYNIFLGSYSGLSETASNKVILGSGNFGNYFDSPNTNKDIQFAVGVRTDANPSKYWLVGNENFNIGIGTTNPTSKLTVGGDGYFTGIVTASNFYVGNNLVGTAGSLTDLYVSGVSTFIGNITGSNASFSGNVTIGGTLTYEDVTNVDAIGLVTARNGARILSGGLEVVGVSTFSNLIDSNGGLNVIGGTILDQLEVTGVSTLAILTVNNQFYYVPSYENGVAYFDSSGLMVSTGTTSSSIDYTNYILTTDNLGIPVWSSVIDGGSY